MIGPIGRVSIDSYHYLPERGEYVKIREVFKDIYLTDIDNINDLVFYASMETYRINPEWRYMVVEESPFVSIPIKGFYFVLEDLNDE